MSATITLGVGPDAIEVEDGSEVPLNGGSARRGIVHAHNHLILCHLPGGGVVRLMADGAFHPTPGQGPSGIDLAALRRERAPRPQPKASWTSDGYWCRGVTTLAISQQTNGIPIGADREFWTHRPGNTPEKQAAFDAALDAWVDGPGSCSWRDTSGPEKPLYRAARALGYGRKP